MRKKKGAISTLALAGAIVASGSIGLHVSMAHDMKEEQTTQIEQKHEMSLGINQEDATQEKQVWLNDESIYLPEDAEIVEKSEVCYEITWDNYSITYWQDEYTAKETKEDLGLGKLMPILENTIEKYSGQDMEDCELDICLVGSMDADEGMDSFATMTYDYDDSEKCYQVQVSGVGQHGYVICVDSVTGEVTSFYHEDGSLGSFSNGWEIPAEEADIVEFELSEADQKEFDSIIEAFVVNDLKLGDVEKMYGHNVGLAYINNDNNDERAYYSVICKTDNGTAVEVTVDCGEKEVIGFNIDAVYMMEE